MKHYAKFITLVLLCALLLTGCGCKHIWYAATCDTPKTCSECGETEGEALGHSWAEATCEEAKHCTYCNKTEGEALGHTWEEATTEAPKTCTTCGETEGERIITDPRFVTAAVEPLLGKWVGNCSFSAAEMGIDNFNGVLELEVTMEFCNDGNFVADAKVTNAEAFKEAMIQYTIELTYQELAASGYSREQADELMIASAGYDIPTYVEMALAGFDVEQIFTDNLDVSALSGVYYMEGGTLYTGSSWDDMGEEAYTLENNVLTLDALNEGLGTDVTFTPAN